MNLLLDTGILGQLCHPSKQSNQQVADWVEAILTSGSDDRVYLPEPLQAALEGPLSDASRADVDWFLKECLSELATSLSSRATVAI